MVIWIKIHHALQSLLAKGSPPLIHMICMCRSTWRVEKVGVHFTPLSP
jgi:hypothetical protein